MNIYTAKDGDELDAIAFSFYGDNTMFLAVTKQPENAPLLLKPFLDAGDRVHLPDKEEQPQVDEVNPWG